MKTLTTVIPSIAIVLLLSSCALVERARMYGAEAAARAVALECSLSQPERQKNLDAVNGWLLANSVTGRAVALDCDGDGTPDF
ncbi:hypothetical protein LCGC14_2532700 [marine sediment metagenome]|uniref:Lipoprotein n=1 Tax=marine sediment metagenome TaxID=412755 RepID=A0A0F9DLD1_9ZZZZ